MNPHILPQKYSYATAEYLMELWVFNSSRVQLKSHNLYTFKRVGLQKDFVFIVNLANKSTKLLWSAILSRQPGNYWLSEERNLCVNAVDQTGQFIPAHSFSLHDRTGARW